MDLTACFKLRDFSPLNKLHKLRHLSLFNTRVNDLSFVGELRGLETLNVSCCDNLRLSVNGCFENLKNLYISERQVNEREIENFNSRFPNCKISFEISNDLFREGFSSSDAQRLLDERDIPPLFDDYS